MSNVKERIIGAVTVMNENDAEKIWEMIQAIFTLSNVEQDAPDADELEALNAYKNGDADYQPSVSHDELKKQLGL